jgi:hypothetical protein
MPIPHAEIYKRSDYLEKNPTWHVEESSFKAKYVLNLLRRNSLSPKTVCEAGCGAGEVLQQLQLQMGPDTDFCGYEISPIAFELSKPRQYEKLRFKLADLGKEGDVCFDLLLVLDVIEHVEDYFSFLREIRLRAHYKLFHIPLDLSVQAVLHKDGLLKRRRMHAHLNYFTKETAIETLKDSGYEILDYFYPARSNEIGPTLLQKSFRIPRSIFFAIHQDLAVRVLGGYTQMVLAK